MSKMRNQDKNFFFIFEKKIKKEKSIIKTRIKKNNFYKNLYIKKLKK